MDRAVFKAHVNIAGKPAQMNAYFAKEREKYAKAHDDCADDNEYFSNRCHFRFSFACKNSVSVIGVPGPSLAR